MQGGSYGKVVSHVIIGLKTVKGAKQLKLDPTIYDSLQKEKVRHPWSVLLFPLTVLGNQPRCSKFVV